MHGDKEKQQAQLLVAILKLPPSGKATKMFGRMRHGRRQFWETRHLVFLCFVFYSDLLQVWQVSGY